VRGATSFLLDPATGEIDQLDRGRIWRPVVDPSGKWVVYWEGALATDGAGIDWQPATGRIEIAPWRGPGARPGASPSAATASRTAPVASRGAPTASPTTTASPASSAKASGPAANPDAAAGSGPGSGGRPGPTAGPHGLADGPLVDFDAQFDPTGRLLAIWIADSANPSSGFLTLYAIDEATGAATPAHPPLVAVPALRGFSIGSGRLAWVSPPGPSGADSRIQIVGWTDTGFGTVESAPAESLLVLR
jgi:hypothetical protein